MLPQVSNYIRPRFSASKFTCNCLLNCTFWELSTFSNSFPLVTHFFDESFHQILPKMRPKQARKKRSVARKGAIGWCQNLHSKKQFAAITAASELGKASRLCPPLHMAWKMNFEMCLEKCRNLSKTKPWTQMGISKNRGTPKWMVYKGKPY